MKFKFTSYPDGIHELTFKNNVKNLELGEPFTGDVDLTCIMDKSRHQIVLKCNAVFFAEFDCDRCNDPFKLKLNSDFTLVKVFDPRDADPEDVNTEYLPSDINVIDLTPDLKEYILIELPMKRLCSEDCKGLCLNCGTNLNKENCICEKKSHNPIWDDLIKRQDKLN